MKNRLSKTRAYIKESRIFLQVVLLFREWQSSKLILTKKKLSTLLHFTEQMRKCFLSDFSVAESGISFFFPLAILSLLGVRNAWAGICASSPVTELRLESGPPEEIWGVVYPCVNVAQSAHKILVDFLLVIGELQILSAIIEGLIILRRSSFGYLSSFHFEGIIILFIIRNTFSGET